MSPSSGHCTLNMEATDSFELLVSTRLYGVTYKKTISWNLYLSFSDPSYFLILPFCFIIFSFLMFIISFSFSSSCSYFFFFMLSYLSPTPSCYISLPFYHLVFMLLLLVTTTTTTTTTTTILLLLAAGFTAEGSEFESQ
jgi:hypothetical protein